MDREIDPRLQRIYLLMQENCCHSPRCQDCNVKCEIVEAAEELAEDLKRTAWELNQLC